MTICSNPEECCKELTRVWEALGNPKFNGRSCAEQVRDLVSELAQAKADVEHWARQPW